jgi:S-adenosylmethionine:tRNA ribosyltransferase-isomerase
MSPAAWPRPSPLDERMIVVDPRASSFELTQVGALVDFLRPQDLVVVNDAATLPASLFGATEAGEPLEARLLASRDGTWRAVLFGAGDWRTRTEDRAPPPPLRSGDSIRFGEGLEAEVVRVLASLSRRLVDLRFTTGGDRFWSALYRAGRPVQYSHVAGPLSLWHVQTPFGSRPWASEMPSASRPLAWELVLGLRRKGIRFASLTHAAGLSSSGDPALDAAFPLRESFDVPAGTAAAVNAARAEGGRVIAAGTSVVRALESIAGEARGRLRAARGETELIVDGSHRLRAVDALFTGMHDPGTSHDALLHAFASEDVLRRAHAEATAQGFLGHEFGDSMLILAPSQSVASC